MKVRVRINKSRDDAYILECNHIPRYREFIDIADRRYRVEYVVHNVEEVLQNEITDVIIYVSEIY